MGCLYEVRNGWAESEDPGREFTSELVLEHDVDEVKQ